MVAQSNRSCNTYVLHTHCKVYHTLAVVIDMKKFKIPNVPPTTTKSIRFPNDMIEQIEQEIQGKNCTFTAFVVEAVRVALENLHEEEQS